MLLIIYYNLGIYLNDEKHYIYEFLDLEIIYSMCNIKTETQSYIIKNLVKDKKNIFTSLHTYMSNLIFSKKEIIVNYLNIFIVTIFQFRHH